MKIDDALLRPVANNLTLVRLVLASAVIWTHSFWRVTGIEGTDEFNWLLGTPISAFAVDGFFFLSGFLVYASLLRRSGVVDFTVARVARLWPALAVSVVATVAIGALLTTAAPVAYLGGATAKFVLGNLSLLFGSYSLTGVDCGAGPCVVNGSLWTIPWEVRCYALLAILSLVGFARPRLMAWVVLPATLAGALLWHVPAVPRLVEAALGPGIVYNLNLVDRLWTTFALGAAAFLFRDRIALNWGVLLAIYAASAGARWLGDPVHLDSLFVGYAVLCAGFLTARRGAVSGRWPDYSYGMYIYAFPVMMLLAGGFAFRHHGWLALANLACTLPLAALSWHLIEKPALGFAHRLRRGRPVTAPEPSATATQAR